MAPTPLATDDFYDLSTPTAVAVSPTGDRAAVAVEAFDADADERLSSVFVVPTDGSEPPHRLTRASTATQPRWSPDGTRLGVIAKRETALDRRIGRAEDDDDENGSDGDEEPTPQVWVFDLARGGDAMQVTDRVEGVREFDWSPGGDRIVVSARDPTDDQETMLEDRRDGGPIEIDRLQHKADGVGWLDDVTTYLFVVDVASGEETRLDRAYGSGALEPLMGLHPSWGERGIAFVTNLSEHPDESMASDCYVVDPDDPDADLDRITDGDLRVANPVWSPDGDRLAFVGGHPSNWYRPSQVFVADVEAGGYESTTESLDRTVAMGHAAHWLDEDTLLTAVGDGGWTRLVRCSPGTDPERVFEGLGRGRTVQQLGVGGDTVAVGISAPADGHDVFAFSAADLGTDALESADADGAITRLSAFNDDLVAERVWPTVERVEYENGDGVTVEGLHYRPPDAADDEPLPLVVSIHGGPMSYDAPEFRFDVGYFVGQGYAVFKPNYRGSTSYGREFSESLRGTRGRLETDDVTSGVDHLVAAGAVDPDRTFLTGFSYGGITTAHVLTRVDGFAAGAAEHGIYDFYSNFGTDDNHLWHEDEFGLPWEVPETYRDISSITRVGEIETPLLLTAGEHDWRCPPTQAEQLYLSVKKQGVDSKLVVYQDEHHAITNPDRAIHRLETLAGWFADHDPGAE